MKYTVEIERMAYSACAIAHLPEGKTVFVEEGAPEDVAEIEIDEEKESFAHGFITKLLEPSPHRVKPLSPIDQACGTAPWQHLSYNAQLIAKREIITGALVHTARFDSARAEEIVEKCVRSRREWGYRNKLELGASLDSSNRFILGYHREGSDELVSIDSSLLVHPAIEKAPKALRGAIRYAQGNRDLGIFRIGVRHSLATNDLEVALWTQPGSFPRNLFAKTLSSALKTTSIVRVLADPGKARKIKGVEILNGRGYWRERIGNVEFSTQAPSFFQVNTAQADRLVALVKESLGSLDGAYIADLFAGGGTFSIPLALAGADVVAVESAASSVRDLRYNANANNVEIEVIGGDATRELEGLGKLDALVVDPPRAGLSEPIIQSIVDARPASFAYISCNPSTWARDVARFEEKGMSLIRAVPVDLFPQTYHTEIASFFEAS